MNRHNESKFGSGDNYEAQIGFGGRFFRPLDELASLSTHEKEKLMIFQAEMPDDVYAFVFEPSKYGKGWLKTDDDLMDRYVYGEKPTIKLLTILGSQKYDKERYQPPNFFRRISSRKRYRRAIQAVQVIRERADEMALSNPNFQFELIVAHADSLRAHISAIFVMESLGEIEPMKVEEGDRFYRLIE